ncbi:beta-ketoacyl synthase N-terminal-like domain-containing protein, partial [Algoriphagus sp.]|uniref:beta-ketoacyl synthase N-terminal-like domain-containing protein n=1 Tax=Algoriphagus sp. TaxID=1872435 RepID=UPI0025D6BD60
AIIGQGCVLPGCFSPEELWQMVVENKVNISAEKVNTWRVKMEDEIVGPTDTSTKDKSWHNLGGYISDFDQHFDINSYKVEPAIIDVLDPLFKWCFHSAKSALEEAGYTEHEVLAKTGLILGNLSYPSRSFCQYFEEQHLKAMFPEWKNPSRYIDPINRFMSGFPAMITAKALGLEGDSFSIDAACASSLYALKIACDKLNGGSQDMMLVGGVCASDPFLLHNGFTALNALSPSGQSRPFNEAADGLIPSEGAGFIVVKRLKDAVKSGDNILGVIRGIGLSNDGRQGGFLVPSQSGQVKSMQDALEVSGILPEEISYIECHATGTSTGDTIEIKSMGEVYSSSSKIHLSSLKGNIGHAITASGIGSIFKVLSAFKNKVLPPVPNSEPLNTILSDSIFTVSSKAEPWKSKSNRIAGISNFGFCGNNAHLLLEEWNPKTNYESVSANPKKSKVAVIGVEIQSSDFPNAKAYLSHLLGNPKSVEKKKNISFEVKELSSPPKDLKLALSQQLLMLNTIQNLIMQGIHLGKDDTGVFIGMGADAEINRYGFRKRIKDLLDDGEVSATSYDLDQIKTDIGEVLVSAGVLGTMPNVPANRINYHFDYCGMGYTLSAEELSGTKALEVAIQSIQNNELSAALVGAVDMSDEFVNSKALKDVLGVDWPLTDTAVVVALKNNDAAIKDGDKILASIDPNEIREERYTLEKDWVISKMGYSHASSGLIEVATSILLIRNRLQLTKDHSLLKPILESDKGFSYDISCRSFFGGESNFQINSEVIEDIQTRATGDVLIHCYSGLNKEELIDSIQKNVYSEDKKYRLGIVSTADDLQQQRELAIQLVSGNPNLDGWITPNIHFRKERIQGDIAFAYTGAASAYPKMGKSLLEEFPGLIGALKPYCSNIAFATNWIYEVGSKEEKLPFYQLAGSSLMCQIHTAFTKEILGLMPEAVIGLSSGETNSMFAMGVWEDMSGLLHSTLDSGLYSKALGGEFESVKEHWGLLPNVNVNWVNWRILASVAQVKKLLEKEERAYLSIVNTKNDCVIGGDKDACERIIKELGTNKAMPLEHDIAIHCAPVLPFEKAWRKLHTRKVNEVKGVRFYSNYLDGVYTPTSESVADALTGQAVNPIDFTRIVEKAWEDGIRVFVEFGPRNSLGVAIKEILGDKEFVCVSMDRAGQSSLIETMRATTELWAAGVPVNLESLKAKHPKKENSIKIDFPMHMTEIKNKKKLNPIGLKEEVNKNTNPFREAPSFAIAKRKRKTIIAEENINGIREKSQAESFERKNVASPEIENNSDTQNDLNNFEENEIVELLRNQHAIMSEAHENYLAAHLAAQQNFSAFMKNMQDSLFEPENDWQKVGFEKNLQEIQFNSEQEEPIFNSDIAELASHKVNSLNRHELEILSSGRISSVFGPLFEYQDDYALQVRPPQPPYLICDRVTKIEGEPGSLGLGTIWTEIDV